MTSLFLGSLAHFRPLRPRMLILTTRLGTFRHALLRHFLFASGSRLAPSSMTRPSAVVLGHDLRFYSGQLYKNVWSMSPRPSFPHPTGTLPLSRLFPRPSPLVNVHCPLFSITSSTDPSLYRHAFLREFLPPQELPQASLGLPRHSPLGSLRVRPRIR